MNQDEYYSKKYESILNEGSVGFVSNLVHKSLEFGFEDKTFDKVLELGAGKGQHLKFIKHSFSQYFETDIRIENLPDRAAINDGIAPDSIKTLQANAENLNNFDDSSVDRIITTCLLVHLSNPEKALEDWKRVVKNGGLITIYVPCEPGLLLRGLRYLTTVQKAKRAGLDHLGFHYREHVTYFVRLWILISSVFKDSKIKKTYYPFGIPSWNINLWTVIQIRVSK